MLDFIPTYLKNKILSEFPTVCEVRLRQGVKTEVYYLADSGVVKRATLNNSLNSEQLNECVMKLCDYSLFSVEESVKQGFITSENGERVGLCGECVYDRGQVVTVKNFTSLCVRIPRGVIGCSDEFFGRYIKSNASCLIFSPPFQGKTTFIRDLGRNYSDKLGLDVLYSDERNEFVISNTDMGERFDTLKFADKEFLFKCGVRALNPDTVVCDEMVGEKDFSAVASCMLAGVKTIASTHSDNIKNIAKKLEKSGIIENSLFDFYVCLSGFKVAKVYDGELLPI